ncbi:MAG: hydantoinase/oxoprolinase family protein [Deltaproteobacteria bacterium]|nr:hydantoinase/oxoprolinase family protein [Deltaproteobacteria bacterium]
MILGIDIGGTHTDAVCIEGRNIVSTAKALTGDDLVQSVLEVAGRLDIHYSDIDRVVLSTTLSTNAIIERKFAPTGMIVSAGPGIDPRQYFLTEDFYLIDGAIDHRGREYVPIREDQVLQIAKELKHRDITGVGIVSKFSVRNPVHETKIHALIENDFKNISLGHTMSGSLNFYRRLNTTYFNTAVTPVQERFVKSVRQALQELGVRCPLFFLKADGGTYSSSAAHRLPVETILSGPAASMMGAVALCEDTGKTTLVLDVGGTTTDIGVLINGVPVLEPKGVSIDSLKTLVRGLKVVSVGAGGDSFVCLKGDTVCAGPQRMGAPAVMGGEGPTPMDAFSVLGEFDQGDKARAHAAVSAIAGRLGRDVKDVAREIISVLVDNIRTRALEFIDEVNSHPVYTIYEMLHPDLVVPEQVMVIGGPATLLKPYIEEAFQLKCVVPEHAMVANALGAALARTTAQITMLADTQLGRFVCPELGIDDEISRNLCLEDLKVMGEKAMKDNAEFLGLTGDIEISILEEQSFNMVRGFSTTGKNMRLKLQTKPGIINEWRSR